MRLIITGILLLLAVNATQAAYITDKLVAGLYKEAKVTDKPLKALASGTPLEVVSRKNGFIKVRTSDGVIGWVESAYLTDEKPARSILLDTQAKLSILQKKLDKLSQLEKNADAAKAVDEIATLGEKQLAADLQKQHEAAVKVLQNENASLKKQIQQVADILNVSVSNTTAKPEKATMSENTDHQAGRPLLANLTASVSNRLFWMIGIAILLLGFVAGYFVMRLRVQHRFGPMFRL